MTSWLVLRRRGRSAVIVAPTVFVLANLAVWAYGVVVLFTFGSDQGNF